MRFAFNLAAMLRSVVSVGQLLALIWIGVELHSIARDTGHRDPAAQQEADALQEISQRLGKISEAIILSGR